jgi:hypothetical protein
METMTEGGRVIICFYFIRKKSSKAFFFLFDTEGDKKKMKVLFIFYYIAPNYLIKYFYLIFDFLLLQLIFDGEGEEELLETQFIVGVLITLN